MSTFWSSLNGLFSNICRPNKPKASLTMLSLNRKWEIYFRLFILLYWKSLNPLIKSIFGFKRLNSLHLKILYCLSICIKYWILINKLTKSHNLIPLSCKKQNNPIKNRKIFLRTIKNPFTSKKSLRQLMLKVQINIHHKHLSQQVYQFKKCKDK